MQIAIQLKKDSRRSLQHQIYDGIRCLILSGGLSPGQRLPSTREMAVLLSVSRTTTSLAYELLCAEGYITSSSTAGTFVSNKIPEELLWTYDNTKRGKHNPALGKLHLSGFAAKFAKLTLKVPAQSALVTVSSNSPSLQDFPVELWKSLYQKRLKQSSAEALGYAPADGCSELKRAIAEYLPLARGVKCSADQIIVTFGSKQALDLIARIHLDEDNIVGIENPGYPGARQSFLSRGATLAPISVDDSTGAQTAEIASLPSATKLVYVTPSHQYPLGGTMPLGQRLRLLKLAQSRDFLVVEDDYDSEFRYGERPIPALQGLDDFQKVIYVGTFSKILFPSLRIGYIVAPPALAETYAYCQDTLYGHPSYLDQLVVADFISQGHLHRHVRRMRLIYEQRRLAAIRAFSKASKSIKIVGDSAGLHFVIRIACSNEKLLSKRLRLAGFEFATTERCYTGGYRSTELVIGFGCLAEQEITTAMRAFKKALSDV
jgi:GntR family transcriptional regulator/MocR family aminotransferase